MIICKKTTINNKTKPKTSGLSRCFKCNYTKVMFKDCVLNMNDLLGYGVRQIIGASPQTSCLQASKYMSIMKKLR